MRNLSASSISPFSLSQYHSFHVYMWLYLPMNPLAVIDSRQVLENNHPASATQFPLEQQWPFKRTTQLFKRNVTC